jgi:hypothetical protein
LALVAIALIVIFLIHPGGFETGIGWFFAVLPGALPAILVSDHIYRVAPSIERAAYWLLLVGISFVWYWAITFVLIKASRLVVRRGTGS